MYGLKMKVIFIVLFLLSCTSSPNKESRVNLNQQKNSINNTVDCNSCINETGCYSVINEDNFGLLKRTLYLTCQSGHFR